MQAVLLSLAGVFVASVLSFWGWLAVKVIQQGGKLVELEQRVNSQEKCCDERLLWLQRMDDKMNKTAEGVAKLVGYLMPHEQEEGD